MSAIPSPALQHAIALSLGGSVVRSDDLIARVMEHGFQYRGYVSNAVAKAVRCGMILRVGEGLARNYRLNPDWKIDPTALAAAQAQRVRGGQVRQGRRRPNPLLAATKAPPSTKAR